MIGPGDTREKSRTLPVKGRTIRRQSQERMISWKEPNALRALAPSMIH